MMAAQTKAPLRDATLTGVCWNRERRAAAEPAIAAILWPTARQALARAVGLTSI